MSQRIKKDAENKIKSHRLLVMLVDMLRYLNVKDVSDDDDVMWMLCMGE